MKRKFSGVVLAAVFAVFGCFCAMASDDREITFFFTHDIHSYLEPVVSSSGGETFEHGGGARLQGALRANGFPGDANAFFLDGGDFSQGTLFQTGYEDEAFELRLLGRLGALASTPGNHEWDHGGRGFAAMLDGAMKSGDPLPSLCLANLDFSGELSEEQVLVRDTLSRYSEKVAGDTEFRYRIVTAPNGLKIGIFGVSGENSIEDSPTSGMKWIDKIEAAKEIVGILEPQADLIVCLSHTGTESREEGEDIDLAKVVPEIDFILSGHSHSLYEEAVVIGNTVIGSTGEYLRNLGKVTFTVASDGSVSLKDYRLIPVDESQTEEPETAEFIRSAKEWITSNYLAAYDSEYEDVVCESSYDMITLSEMYGSHQEYTTGNLIADSYIYAAKKNGIEDIDVALVGLGTIRGSIRKGITKLTDAFGICSLGMGSDQSAGHPIVTAYITGKELKLLTELDASLGNFVSSIKMSYSGTGPDGLGSGLSYTFNEKRMLLDRVTEVYLLKDGKQVEIEDGKLYKVACNMYAANMLGMLNGLTRGLLSITPKDASGNPIEDFYTCALTSADGREIKEWVAFKEYLGSFRDTDGDQISDLPLYYQKPLGRKNKVSEGGLSVIRHPGGTTLFAGGLALLLLLGIVFLVRGIMKRKKGKKKP